MRELITGSSGQIGTNLALRLLRDRHAALGKARELLGYQPGTQLALGIKRAIEWTRRAESEQRAAPPAPVLS